MKFTQNLPMYQCIKDNTMVAREKHSYPINFNETNPHFITHPYFTPSHFSEKKLIQTRQLHSVMFLVVKILGNIKIKTRETE